MTSQPAQPKEKRGVASGRRRRQLLLLVAALQRLQSEPEFSELRQDIQNNIDGHVREAARTRSDDRRAVLAALQEWRDGLLVEEIVDETGLSTWVVRHVLEELQETNPPLVGFREKVQNRERGSVIERPDGINRILSLSAACQGLVNN